VKRTKLLVLLVSAAVLCVAGVVNYCVMTNRAMVAPLAGIATAVALVCAMVPVWMQHR
jgi:hypothetical protein